MENLKQNPSFFSFNLVFFSFNLKHISASDLVSEQVGFMLEIFESEEKLTYRRKKKRTTTKKTRSETDLKHNYFKTMMCQSI